MGQTLSHGVYLPNEGERNCYAGLASNWQILNTAVGNIAEKAPLVHTHTVSQITDFPAYGNTAGTICEGNDSRLSDARTPVAHTHTKSDVTDLLNSDFIPSANNSYDLGSSAYQWNNLYAKRVNTQSVNGINPGALSLPDYSKASNIDTTSWNKNGTLTSYTPTMNGWLQITLPDDADNNGKYTNKIIILDSTAPNPITGQASATVGDIRIYLTYPVIANRTYSLYIKSYSNTITAARFIPCQGNV